MVEMALSQVQRRTLWRFALIILCGGLAYFSASSTFTLIARTINADVVLGHNPDEPVALSVKADQILLTSQSITTFAQIRKMATRSLRGQAINPRALRQLAYVADTDNQKQKALSFITLSQTISRRDTLTYLWLIESRVIENDIAGALKYYDRALRVQSATADFFFSRLIGAVEDLDIRKAFLPYVKADPPWLGSFINYAIDQSPNPAAITDMVMRAGGMPKDTKYRAMETRLLSRLVSELHFDEARAYVLTFKTADQQIFSSVALDQQGTSDRHGPFAWQRIANPAVGADYLDGTRPGFRRLAAFASSGESGLAARKLLFIAPGSYSLITGYSTAKIPNSAVAEWRLSCVEKTGLRPVWQSNIVQPSLKTKTTSPFVIPPGCDAHYLDLTLTAGEDKDGVELTVDSIGIARAG